MKLSGAKGPTYHRLGSCHRDTNFILTQGNGQTLIYKRGFLINNFNSPKNEPKKTKAVSRHRILCYDLEEFYGFITKKKKKKEI